jgi:hypothetical protein
MTFARTSSFKLQASSFKLQASSFKLQASSFKLEHFSSDNKVRTGQNQEKKLVLSFSICSERHKHVTLLTRVARLSRESRLHIAGRICYV